MKTWQRGAVIGALWAILGLLFFILSKIMKFYFYILNLPFIIFRGYLINLPKNEGLFIILTLIFWTGIGAVLGYIYQKSKEQKAEEKS